MNLHRSALTMLPHKALALLPWAMLAGLFAIALAFAGLYTALAPTFVVRLVPVLVLPLIMIIAYMRRTDEPLSERVTLAWLFWLALVFIVSPPYAVFKFGPLPAIDARRIAAGFSLLALFYLMIGRAGVFARMTGKVRGARLTVICTLGYVLWRFITTVDSDVFLRAFLNVGWDFLYYQGIFLVALALFASPRHAALLFRLMLVATVLIGGYALIEKRLGRNPLVDVLLNRSFIESSGLVMQIMGRLRDGDFRAQSLFDHPLTLAEFSSIGACFGLAALLWPLRLRWRLTGAAALVLGLAGAWASVTRAGLLAAAGALFITFLLWLLRARSDRGAAAATLRKLVFCGVLAGIAAIAVPLASMFIQGRSVGEQGSTQARIYMLKMGLPSVVDHPVFGTSVGSASAVAAVRGERNTSTLDNQWLAIAIESGVPAFLFLLGSLALPAWFAMSRLFRRPDAFSPFLAAGVGAVVVSLAMRSIMWLQTNLSLLYILGAVMLACAAWHGDDNEAEW